MNGKRTTIPFTVCILLFFVTGLAGAADLDGFNYLFESSYIPGFPENYTTRRRYGDFISAASLSGKMLMTMEKSEDQEKMVKVYTEAQNGSTYLLFVNEMDYTFPIYSRGSYIIKKDSVTGEIRQIKIFIRSDKESFVRIFPAGQNGERSRMDLYLYGYPLYRHVILSRTVQQLATAPFSEIVSAAGVVDWDMVFPDQDSWAYRHVADMVSSIRDVIDTLPDMDDGAMNENGEFVLIETGQTPVAGGFNCSGFAKWVVDGMVHPLTGSLMPIGPLKEKHGDARGHAWSEPQEDARDPYFGLDWTRNLARMLEAARLGRVGPDEFSVEFADVKQVPFFPYTEDVGFEARFLPVIMYLLAGQDPGYFYLASVNDTAGTGLDLRQHFHVALLFPYFDENGRFETAVFERNYETPIESFAARYPGAYVHLVRIPGLKDFDPPRVQNPLIVDES